MKKLKKLLFRFVFCITIVGSFSTLIVGYSESVSNSFDWPSFRGDQQLTGVANGRFPDDIELLWTFETKDAIESTSAIYDGTVYVGSLDGYLYAVNLETGQVKWKYQATDEIKSSPSVYESTIYFGDEQGTFHAVDIQTNQKKWIFQADAGIISSANFIDDRILFGSYDQCLYCLDAKTGVLIWKFETEGYVHGAPAIVDK